MSRIGGIARVTPTVARVCSYAALDRLRPRSASAGGDVPPDAARLSSQWLTRALCGDVPGARVVSAEPDGGSAGTTTRLRLRIAYNDAGAAAGLPATVFTKSSPALQQRITQAITGPVETLFYTRLRERVDIEAPRCFHGVVDERRMTALMLLEDLVATKQVTFMDPTTPVSLEMAAQVVDTLAALHGTFATLPPPGFVKTYPGHWEDAFALVNVRRYFVRCFDEAGDLIAAPVRRDPHRAWDAVLRSIALHDRLPATLIHNDVHLGNWYRTAEGVMGLSDWQCVVSGHWSRDLAYALATMLTIEDRREWERDLVARYADALPAAGGPATTAAEAFDAYRSQVWGALAYWAPTYSPPRLMPSNMQPRSISGELLRRISTACDDLDAFAAVGA
jgi:hypothetical protein